MIPAHLALPEVRCYTPIPAARSNESFLSLFLTKGRIVH